MSNIRSIITEHRQKMVNAGFLREAGAGQLSPQVAALRPSLTKINRALIENPDLLRNLSQPSPMALLFEYTLPKIEPLLVELGEEKAKIIIASLCKHGMEMIAEHGAEKASGHLEQLFKDLPEYPVFLENDYLRVGLMGSYRTLYFQNSGIILEQLLTEWAGGGNATILPNRMIKLSLSGDSDSRRLSGLKGLNKLEALYVEAISGLDKLKDLPNLKKLGIRILFFTDAEEWGNLGSLTDLESLVIRNPGIPDRLLADKLSSLTGLNKIREFGINHWNSDVTSLSIEKISQLFPKLESLLLGQSNVTDHELKYLEAMRLKGLRLNRTRITDAGLEKLKGMPLQILDLSETKVTNDGLAHLIGMPLQNLDLSDTMITDEGLSHLKKMPLKQLCLEGTLISDKGLIHLKDIPLQLLWVDEKQITAADCEALMNATPGLWIERR